MIRLIIIGGLGIIGYLLLFSQDTLITMTQREALKKALGDINKAPDFTLTALNDSVYNLRELEGKVVLVNFWATWCGPCRMEIPEFNELHKSYHERGLEILGISVSDNKKQLDVLIREVVQFIKDGDTAVQLIPAIKEYLDILRKINENKG